MQCRKCGKVGEERVFATFRDRKGVMKRRGECQHCRDLYHQKNFEKLQAWRREYNQKNRSKSAERSARIRAETRAYVDEVKSVPCTDCGVKWPPVAMDFDHVSGAKIKSVSSMVAAAYRMDLIKAEIAKCEVVCACCHRIRTARRGENLAPGTSEVQRHSTSGKRLRVGDGGEL